MWEFNYGEWSEAYVFLRLLADGRIYAADSDFKRNNNVYIDILSVLRHEKDRMLEFKREIDESIVRSYENSVQFKIVTCDQLREKANFLYESIKGITTSDRTFPVPEIEDYLKELRFSQPKIPKLPADVQEKYGKKTDIIITIEDSSDSAISTTGFSIKSHLGQASTLFNSAIASKLIYEIEGCDDAQMDIINGIQIDSETGMIDYIKSQPELSLSYIDTSEEFQNNLDLIELSMAKILGWMMLIQIGYYEKAASTKIKDIVTRLSEMNPIGVRRPEVWYETKFKDFLFASFSGMTATEPWDGRRTLSGGYIDVGQNGDILYYRAISDDVFNTFLYNNTRIDRPSRGVNKDIAKVKALAHLDGRNASTPEVYAATLGKNGKPKAKKGDWGYVYKEGEKYYLAINFQIRFK